MADEKEPQTEETTEPSEKVENSEETQSQEKPVTQEVSKESEPTEESEESEVSEETKETEETEPEERNSVLDELLEGAKKTQEVEPKEESSDSVADQSGIGEAEKEIARGVFPQMDPSSTEFNAKFEEQVVKDYLYQWAMAGARGQRGPTLRSVASQVASEAPKPSNPSPKKAEASATPSTTPGPEAERIISSDDERRLMEGAKVGNKDAIVELLRARRQKSAE